MTKLRKSIPGLMLLAVLGACGTLSAEIKVVAEYKPDGKPGDKCTELKDTTGGGKDLKADGGDITFTDGDPRSKTAAVKLDGKAFLQRQGLASGLNDNFVAEVFCKPGNEDQFKVVLQYGSGGHGWSILRNGKAFQVLLGGKALIGWSGDVAPGQWVHLAVARYDGNIRLLVNGREAGAGNQQPNDADANATFTLGASNEKNSQFTGDIGRARVTRFDAGEFSTDWLLINDPEGKKLAAKNKASQEPMKGAQGKASIIFDNPPRKEGLTYSEAHTRVAEVEGKTALIAEYLSVPEILWARALNLTFTDKSFKDGKSPVVDIEVEYRQTFNAPVILKADTARGSVEVGSGWGNNPGWQRFSARIDDAKFSSSQYGHKPEDLATDGYDLRLLSFAQDFQVRSIKIKAYDLENDPDYTRLLRFDRLETKGEVGDCLVYKPGTQNTVNHIFTNLSKKPVALTWNVTISDVLDRPLSNVKGEFTLAPQSASGVPVPIDTKGLRYGVYNTQLTVRRKGEDKDSDPVLQRRGSFLVADLAPVAKAKPGEFLYGLDVGNGGFYDHPRFSKWLEWMGVDIVRNGFKNSEDMNDVDAGMKSLEKQGLQTLFMQDPPKESDAGSRAATLERRIKHLEAVAKKYPQIKYYELGNEPDLTFFYPGPIEEYARSFEAMASAIMKANPSAVPMNGGLCFAGAEGDQRAREFIKVVDASKFGGWAFHGHGPGAQAERNAYERMHGLAVAAGKADKPFAETESGVSASTPLQELVQARTVVQKMVYGQSVNMPFFMFFRLYMQGEQYYMLNSEQEARGSVLAYANLTRQLKGLKFRELLSPLPDGVEGYAFASDDGKQLGAVLWANTGAGSIINLAYGGAVTNARMVDLFGNVSPLKVAAGGTLGVDVGEDPVFVRFEGSGSTKISVVPSPLRVSDTASLAMGGDDVLEIPLKNDGTTDLKAVLTVTAGPKSGVAVKESKQTVSLKPGESTLARVPVTLGSAVESAVEWPRQWAAFVGVDAEKVDAKTVKEIPSNLPRLGGGVVTGQNALPRAEKIDFEALGGKLAEHKPAILLAEVYSPIDQKVTVGASADWWMAWYVNGERVFDTLQSGNGGGYAVGDHVFQMPLKKGKNLVMVRVDAGSQGWKILIGSPERMRQLTSGSDAALTVSLASSDGTPIDSRRVNVRPVTPMNAWTPAAGNWLSGDEVASMQPDAILLDKVENNFAKQPDSSKWWRGPDDLSARVFTRSKGNDLYVIVAVTDDISRPAESIKQVEDGDSVRLWVASADGKTARIDVVGSPKDPVIAAEGWPGGAEAKVTREGTVTLYQIRLPDAAKFNARNLNLRVFDSDDVVAKQHVDLAYPTDPRSAWLRLVWPAK